jgi:hypothetical protein
MSQDTTSIVPVAFVVGSAVVAVHDSERASRRMIATPHASDSQLVDDRTKKKISGFHTGLSRCARTKLSHQKRGEKMHFVLIFSVWL